MVIETRQEFERLIPQLPYIGGKQPFTEFIVFTAMLLAVYHVSKSRGKTVEQTGEDYVYDFIPGDGITFDYGVDYLECASCKFLAKQGAPELAPYLCPVDVLYSEALGWGLTRTKTLAEGADKCDFRFKKGGSTNVAVPVAMRSLVTRGILHENDQ